MSSLLLLLLLLLLSGFFLVTCLFFLDGPPLLPAPLRRFPPGVDMLLAFLK
jgi:hypothetical protein